MNRREKQRSKQLKPSLLNAFNLSNSKEEVNIALEAYGEFLMKNANIYSISVTKNKESYILQCSVYSLLIEKSTLRNHQFENLTIYQDSVEYQLPNSESLEENQIKNIDDIRSLKGKSRKHITVKLHEAKFKTDPNKYADVDVTDVQYANEEFSKEYYRDNNPLDRPFLGGSNISYANSISYGTLGAIVRLEGYEGLFLMTAAHVICPRSWFRNPPEDPSIITVVQPSLRTSLFVVRESENRSIGTVFWWKKDRHFDIAFAKISDNSKAKSGVKIHGAITGIGKPIHGLPVKMYGATTGRDNLTGTIQLEKSIIRDLNDPKKIVTNLFRTTDMGTEGDSGAILLSDHPDSQNMAIGMAIKDAEANFTTFMRLDFLNDVLEGDGSLPDLKFDSFY